MPFIGLDPLSAAIVTALNVPAFTALCPGGVVDDVDQAEAYPFCLYEISERNIGGLGTKAGDGRVLEMRVRLHVFSQYRGFIEAQVVMSKAIELLRDSLTVSGYAFCGEPVHDETIPLGDQEVAAIKTKELVADFRMYLQEP